MEVQVIDYPGSLVSKYKTWITLVPFYRSTRHKLHWLLYWSTRRRLHSLSCIAVQDTGYTDSLVVKYKTQVTLTLSYCSTRRRLHWLSRIAVQDTCYTDSVLHKFSEYCYSDLNVLFLTTLQTLHSVTQYRQFITAFFTCNMSQSFTVR
jgi:hypothetical protein